jgi:peptide chain release factor 1
VKDSIRNKLETTRERFEELEGLMADPDVINDQDQYRDLRKEYARLEPIIRLFQQYETLSKWVKKNEPRWKRNAKHWNWSCRRR